MNNKVSKPKFLNTWTMEGSLEPDGAEVRLPDSRSPQKTVHATFLSREGQTEDIENPILYLRIHA